MPSPEQLVEAAVDKGMDALALTDHWSLIGAVEFYDVCKRSGIHPILGLEFEVEGEGSDEQWV